ncbi:hypothetical protein [Streptomyces venezuelae]|nr:hypothetical protein [Streptomyces venezuelae]
MAFALPVHRTTATDPSVRPLLDASADPEPIGPPPFEKLLENPTP